MLWHNNVLNFFFSPLYSGVPRFVVVVAVHFVCFFNFFFFFCLRVDAGEFGQGGTKGAVFAVLFGTGGAAALADSDEVVVLSIVVIAFGQHCEKWIRFD